MSKPAPLVRIPLRDGTTVEVAGKQIHMLSCLDGVTVIRVGEPSVMYETALTWHEAVALWRQEWHA